MQCNSSPFAEGSTVTSTATISPLTFFVLQDVGCKATFVSDVSGVFAVFLLDDVLQVVVDLSTDAHGLFETACSNWENHELLHGQLVASMGTSIDDIEGLGNINGVKIGVPELQLIQKST